MDEQQSDQNNEDITLEKLQADLDIAMSGWKRAAADFENYKRRKEAENQDLIIFAKEAVIAKLLPILDSLEQALRHSPSFAEASGGGPEHSDRFAQAYQNWQAGISGIVMQLDKALEELGVKKIEAVGKKFDPNFHEAVKEVESGQEDGTVVEEFQTGFELNGKVIRPSQVVISKKK